MQLLGNGRSAPDLSTVCLFSFLVSCLNLLPCLLRCICVCVLSRGVSGCCVRGEVGGASKVVTACANTDALSHLLSPSTRHRSPTVGVLLLRGPSELGEIVAGCVSVLNAMRATPAGAINGASEAAGAGRRLLARGERMCLPAGWS